MVKQTLTLTLTLTFLLSGCQVKKEELVIFYASTLAYPMRKLTREFIKLHPGIKISCEASGSREAARKISELKRKADLLMLADYQVIEDLLIPENTDWYINFARNRMVIVFTEHSKYADEINSENWYKILSRKDVRFGRVNPNLAPLGYRTLFVWQLADLYYKHRGEGKSIYDRLYENCPPNNIRNEEVELLPLLQSLALDYAFEYLSIAKQHHLRFIELPEALDLSNPKLDDWYRKAKVMVSGRNPGEYSTLYGSSIVYALTIPRDAPHPKLAIEFIRFLFSEIGQKIMQESGQPIIMPPIVNNISKIPEVLFREFSRDSLEE